MIRTLIKLRLSALISGFASKNKKGEYVKPSRAKIAGFALLYAFVVIMFAFMATAMILGLGAILVPAGLSVHYFGLVSCLIFAIVFIFSIFETKSELFDCKDNELMLSMPIKAGHIVISRVLVVLIYNYLISALFAIPGTVIYAIYSNGEIKGIIGSLLISAVTPLLATALASAVGYAVAVIAKRMKNKTLATMCTSLIFLALYFWGYTKLLNTAEGEDISAAIIALTEGIGFVGTVGKASLLYPLNTAVYILVCIGGALIAYAIIARFYFSIIMANHSASRTVYKKKELKRTSPFFALSKKELSKFFSSAVYMLNCGIGLIFSVAAAIFVIIKRDMLVMLADSLVHFFPSVDTTAVLALFSSAILLLLSSMSTISACALSLEGDSLWVIKSMPISSRDVLLSKTVPHILISLPFFVLSSLMLAIAFRLDFLSSLLVFIIPIAATVLSAFLGIVFNVLFPKFKYNNEAEPIKQSASVFFTMLAMMLVALVSIGLGVIGVVFSLELLMHILILVLLLALAGGAYLLIRTVCERRCERF